MMILTPASPAQRHKPGGKIPTKQSAELTKITKTLFKAEALISDEPLSLCISVPFMISHTPLSPNTDAIERYSKTRRGRNEEVNRSGKPLNSKNNVYPGKGRSPSDSLVRVIFAKR
jgi:hypothetical protein